MLIPLYLGLIAALGLYVAHFVNEVIEMAFNFMEHVREQNILLLFLLELLDMCLISQLVVMTIQGGYAIFIRPLDEAGFTLPQWLKHGLSTYDQKIKMGMSVINIMIVQILDMFIKMLAMKPQELNELQQQILPMRMEMLGAAIGVTIAFCVINLLQHPEKILGHKGNNDAKH